MLFSLYLVINGGQEAINKLYKGLSEDDKLVHKDLSLEEKKKEIKKFFNFEDKTITYFSSFIYADDFFTLLYNAITGEAVKVEE